MEKEKGYTLVEMIIVILLIGMIGCSVQIGTHRLRVAALKAKGYEVAEGIYYASRCAELTGNMYNSLCFENRVLIREDNLSPAIFTIRMDPHMEVYATKTGVMIIFDGRKAIERAGTIYIYDKGIRRQMRITVGVATNKIRVYYEKM